MPVAYQLLVFRFQRALQLYHIVHASSLPSTDRSPAMRQRGAAYRAIMPGILNVILVVRVFGAAQQAREVEPMLL